MALNLMLSCALGLQELVVGLEAGARRQALVGWVIDQVLRRRAKHHLWRLIPALLWLEDKLIWNIVLRADLLLDLIVLAEALALEVPRTELICVLPCL